MLLRIGKLSEVSNGPTSMRSVSALNFYSNSSRMHNTRLLHCFAIFLVILLSTTGVVASNCVGIPLSLSDIQSCSDNRCLTSQSVVAEIPAAAGSSLCFEAISPTDSTHVDVVDIINDGADIVFPGTSGYNTGDPQTDAHGECSCPGGSDVGCDGRTSPPPFDDARTCKEGVTRGVGCPLPGDGRPTAVVIGFRNQPTHHVMPLIGRTEKDFSFRIKTGNATTSFTYDGTASRVYSSDKLDVTVVSDTVSPSIHPEFVVWPLETKNDAWLLSNEIVNGVDGWETKKIGWIKSGIATDKYYNKIDGTKVSEATTTSFTNCKDDSYVYSIDVLSVPQALRDRQHLLASRVAPGARVTSKNWNMPAVYSASAEGYSAYNQVWKFADYFGIPRMIDTSLPQQLNELDPSCRYVQLAEYAPIPADLTFTPTTGQRFPFRFLQEIDDFFGGPQQALKRAEFDPNFTKEREIMAKLNSNTQPAGAKRFTDYDSNSDSLTPNFFCPVRVDDAILFPYNVWRSSTQEILHGFCHLPVSTAGTVQGVWNCDNFTFVATQYPTQNKHTFHYDDGFIASYVQGVQDVPEALRLPSATGTIRVQLTLKNFPIRFVSTGVRPEIDDIKVDKNEIFIRAHSTSSSGGSCVVGSEPPGVFAAQPIDVPLSPTTTRIVSYLTAYNSTVGVVIRCYSSVVTKNVSMSFDNTPVPQNNTINGQGESTTHRWAGIDWPTWHGIKNLFNLPQGWMTWVIFSIVILVGLLIIYWVLAFVIRRFMFPKLKVSVSKKKL